jgi:hypothetical protein
MLTSSSPIIFGLTLRRCGGWDTGSQERYNDHGGIDQPAHSVGGQCVRFLEPDQPLFFLFDGSPLSALYHVRVKKNVVRNHNRFQHYHGYLDVSPPDTGNYQSRTAFEPIRFCDEQLNGETDRDDPEKSQYYPFQPVIALRDD